MKLDFDYKIFDLKNYLTDIEFEEFSNLIDGFDVDLNEIKSSYQFLCWSNSVINKLNELDNKRYQKIITDGYITYNDFIFLNKMNDDYGFAENDYFNFFLTDMNHHYKKVYEYFKKSYISIIEELFEKKINPIWDHSLLGNINVYPKGSHIKKHTDQDPDKERLFTALFFLNNDRTLDQGSILKLYTEDSVIDIISDFTKCVILEHQNYNYTHEVTKNLVDDVRYSIYNPFTISDYNQKLIHN